MRYKEEMKWLPIGETPKGACWEIYSGNTTHNDWRRPADPKRRAATTRKKTAALRKQTERDGVTSYFGTAPSIMARTRAAVAYCNGLPRKNEASELQAFMSIFHPYVPADKVREITLSKRR